MTPCDDPKKCSSRQPSAFGQSFSENLSGLRRCTPKKYSDQTAFDFGLILCEKSHQPSELCSEKTFKPGRLQLWEDPLRKATPAFGNVPLKNIHARQRSSLGPYSAKIPESLRKRTLKKCSRPPAFVFGSILDKKSEKRSETCPEKTFTPVGLRPLGYAPRKTPPAFGNVPRKNIHALRPSALG